MFGVKIPLCIALPPPPKSITAANKRFPYSPGHNFPYFTVTYRKNGTVLVSQNNSHVSVAADTVGDSAADPTTVQTYDGIGIVEFLRGKNYLITGGTGFVGKVLIEKMLRTIPEVGKIFVLIKAKDMEAAIVRFKTEIIDSQLFECLEQTQGKSYKTFMMSKLIRIIGDVSKFNLGMDDNLADELASQVDRIINSAGNTSYEEMYDIALNINTRGPVRLLHLAKRCKKHVLFLHISKAYVNGTREGIIFEKPLCMGTPTLDVEAEIRLASDTKMSVPTNEVAKKLKELGIERANMHGWQNTYVFTKATGEMIINRTRGDIPTVIVRPTVIESTYKEPFGGWIEGIRMVDPVFLSYGKGQLLGFTGDPKTVRDLVPVDMVVNAILAAIAKHGKMGKLELNIYQIASSLVNPINFARVLKLAHNHFTLAPMTDSKREKISIPDFTFFSSINDFSSYIYNQIVSQNGSSDALISDPRLPRKADHFILMAKLYLPFVFLKAWFDIGNTRKLMKKMSMNENREFGFDVGNINWEHYIRDVHILGLKNYVIKRK